MNTSEILREYAYCPSVVLSSGGDIATVRACAAGDGKLNVSAMGINNTGGIQKNIAGICLPEGVW